tara:strand:+ start:715 stop:915 length:201 start_codon:yes stop_codon:yes gene_type:complete
LSSAARIIMIRSQSRAACASNAASAAVSAEHAECKASGIGAGSCVNQCIAVALKPRSTVEAGRHWL